MMHYPPNASQEFRCMIVASLRSCDQFVRQTLQGIMAALLLVCPYALAHEEDGDLRQNIKLLRPHADKGNAIAQFNLGVIYATGQGAHKNEKEALKWFQQAAAQGFAPAQYRLGVAHASGAGAPRNPVLGYMWLKLASAQGNKDATRAQAELAARLKPAQLDDAENRATRCEKMKYRNCG